MTRVLFILFLFLPALALAGEKAQAIWMETWIE